MDFTLFSDVALYVAEHVPTKGLDDVYWVVPYVAGLRVWRLPVLGTTPSFGSYSSANKADRDTQHTVIKSTLALGYNHVRHSQEVTGLQTRRLSWELMTYIAENPDKSERIVDAILQRGINTTVYKVADYAAIIDAQENIASPVRDGVL